jgi:hypothetical protein
MSFLMKKIRKYKKYGNLVVEILLTVVELEHLTLTVM